MLTARAPCTYCTEWGEKFVQFNYCFFLVYGV